MKLNRKTFTGTLYPRVMKYCLGLALFLPMALAVSCSEDSEQGDPTPAPNSVRVLSSNTRMPSGGTLSSEFSDSPSGCGIAQIVDNNINTDFVTGHASFSIFWNGNEAVPVNTYSLTSTAGSADCDPKTWSLYGSVDNSAWILLDRRVDQRFDERKQTRSFDFTNTRAYRYLKLEVEENNGGAETRIAELGIREIVLSIDDLMEYAYSFTESGTTPMGKHYANQHETTAEDRIWLADASNEPEVPATNRETLSWQEFSVVLFPTAGIPSPADVNQHGVSDCCAVAVFASFAYIYPEFVKSIITDNGDKTYTVAMFDPQGNPVDVTVSSKFLADRTGTIQSASGKNNVACWSTVLEKAIIKWNAVYQVNPDINGIGTEVVAPLFTGNGSSFAFDRGVLDNDQLARAVRVSLQQGKIVVGGFHPGDIPVDGTLTVSGHAYTLMHSTDKAALFTMRNPWGGNPNVDGSADGIINIPDDLDIPPLIDLRIVEPGKAAEYGSGVTDPYIPPVFAPGMSLMRVAPELMHPGR